MAWGYSITTAAAVKGGRQAIGAADASAPLMVVVVVIAPDKAIPEEHSAHRAPGHASPWLAHAGARRPRTTAMTSHALQFQPRMASADQ